METHYTTGRDRYGQPVLACIGEGKMFPSTSPPICTRVRSQVTCGNCKKVMYASSRTGKTNMQLDEFLRTLDVSPERREELVSGKWNIMDAKGEDNA